MTEAEVFNKVRDILAANTDVPSEQISRTDSLIELGLDSLEQVKLMMELEEEFNIEIPDKDAEKLKLVGNISSYIASNIF